MLKFKSIKMNLNLSIPTECLQWMPLSVIYHHLDLAKVSSNSRPSLAILVLRHSLLCVCILRHLHAKSDGL
jgi:hypothetical protein